MISRSPMWMLLATCAFLSAGFSEVAKAAPEQGDGAVNRISIAQASLLISQAAESAPSEAEGEKAPATAIERPTLSLGSSGPLVIQVQVLLEDQGFYEGSIDGEFSEATAEAVKAFQLDQKLEPTGAVDKATWGPLTGESAAPKTADESEKTADSAGANDSAAIAETGAGEAADAKQRLLIGVVALLGLGAGGFGLWKILSVPVPRPLAYPNGSDDDDDFMDAPGPGLGHYPGPDIVAQRGAAGYAPTAITVPATVAAQPPSALTLGAAPVEDVWEEEAEFPADGAGSESHRTEVTGERAMQQETAWQLEQARSQGMARPQETMQEVSVTDAAVAIATQHVKAAQGAEANRGQGQRQGQVRAKDSANSLDKPPTHSPSTAAPQGTAPRGVTPQGVTQRANQQAAQKPVGGNAASGLSPSTGVKQPAIAKARRSSLTPPPPPSEIARVAAAGALEQPELVTTRIARTDIVEVLITDLQGADPAKRRKAIWELGQRSDSRAIQPLVNMMVNSDSRQRSLILAALSEIGTQTLKPMKQALAMSLQDENAEVRKNAIRDLTRIYDLVAQISHLLQAALEDPDPEVQDTARWALKQLNRIRSNAGLEGSQPQQMLQQSVSPPEILSED